MVDRTTILLTDCFLAVGSLWSKSITAFSCWTPQSVHGTLLRSARKSVLSIHSDSRRAC